MHRLMQHSYRSTLRHCRSTSFRRSFAVLGIGEGWTGALVPGDMEIRIRGHHDEAEVDLPVVLYDKGPVTAVSAGWGHTAILVPDRTSGINKLLITGRPYEFPTLLRLYRLPRFIRRYANRQPREKSVQEKSMHIAALLGRFLSWLVDVYKSDTAEDRALLKDWDVAEHYALLTEWTALKTPEPPTSLLCSAGFSAFGSDSGRLYSFGLNTFGQCGVGIQRKFGKEEIYGEEEAAKAEDLTLTRVIWSPEPVAYTKLDTDGKIDFDQEKILSLESFDLGLQHGIGLDAKGQVYCWGKGERGQLGQESVQVQSPYALLVTKAYELGINANVTKPAYREIGKVVQVAAGMVHSAALTADNEVLIWGKYVIPPLPNDAEQGRTASDSKLPCVLKGLPDKKVEQIACGSHHLAILLEDGSVYGVGISTDSKEPLHEPMELIPPGVVDMPVRQFAAHMDRTTVVGADGRQVLQVHLWEDPSFQEVAVFTPEWVDRLLEADPQVRIKEIHRSWLHTVIWTED